MLLAIVEYFRDGRELPDKYVWVIEHFDPKKNANAYDDMPEVVADYLKRIRANEP